MCSRRHVGQAQWRRFAGGLGGGAEGGVAAGELPGGPPTVAGGEVQEGQHQLGGVAVSLSLRAVPPLLRVVGGYDVRQRKAEHLGGNLCVGGGGGEMYWSHHFWANSGFVTLQEPPALRLPTTPAVSFIFWPKCLKPSHLHPGRPLK